MPYRQALPTHLEYGGRLSQERKIRQQQAGDARHASSHDNPTENPVTCFPNFTYNRSHIDRWNRTRNTLHQTDSLTKLNLANAGNLHGENRNS